MAVRCKLEKVILWSNRLRGVETEIVSRVTGIKASDQERMVTT